MPGLIRKKKIAVIGASDNPAKYGNMAVRAYLKKGWKVYPVNLKSNKICGLKCYKSVLDIPEEIDRASVYVPAAVGEKIIREISEKKIKEVYLNPGADSKSLIELANKLGINTVIGCSITALSGSVG